MQSLGVLWRLPRYLRLRSRLTNREAYRLAVWTCKQPKRRDSNFTDKFSDIRLNPPCKEVYGSSAECLHTRENTFQTELCDLLEISRAASHDI